MHAFDDVVESEHFWFSDTDVLVFKFNNGYGAHVSKPAGFYKNKINIWELTPIIRMEEDFWHVDLNNPVVDGIQSELVEFEVFLFLNRLRGFSK